MSLDGRRTGSHGRVPPVTAPLWNGLLDSRDYEKTTITAAAAAAAAAGGVSRRQFAVDERDRSFTPSPGPAPPAKTNIADIPG